MTLWWVCDVLFSGLAPVVVVSRVRGLCLKMKFRFEKVVARSTKMRRTNKIDSAELRRLLVHVGACICNQPHHAHLPGR